MTGMFSPVRPKRRYLILDEDRKVMQAGKLPLRNCGAVLAGIGGTVIHAGGQIPKHCLPAAYRVGKRAGSFDLVAALF